MGHYNGKTFKKLVGPIINDAGEDEWIFEGIIAERQWEVASSISSGSFAM